MAARFGRLLCGSGGVLGAALVPAVRSAARCDNDAAAKPPSTSKATGGCDVECRVDADDPIIAAVVLFRHGARSAVFALPDAAEVPNVYATISAAPPHSVAAHVNGGRGHAQFARAGTPGLLTPVGWFHGEALGRRLRARYGDAAEVVTVRSTDTSRTVLTARAVLSGFEAPSGAVDIDVVPSPALGAGAEGCAALAAMLVEGRRVYRERDPGNAHARAEVARSFARCGVTPPTIIRVHDDCVARRFDGQPPSPCVDVSLCDLCTAESAREIRETLRSGGEAAARLSGGSMHLRLPYASPTPPLHQPYTTPTPHPLHPTP